MLDLLATGDSRREVVVLDGCARWRGVFDSSLFRLVHYQCVANHAGLAAERCFSVPTITLGFAGASIVHWGAQEAQYDLARAVFHRPDVPFRTTHPFGSGCRGVFLLLHSGLADELLASQGSPVRDSTGLSVPPGAYLRARRLIGRLLAGGATDRLSVESEVVSVASELLESIRGSSGLARRAGTRASHERSVRRACAVLQERFRESIGLGELARAANVSPDHLVRLFRDQLGLPVHRYQLRLRLHAALDRICEATTDLSTLAHDLGFSSHSHFTAAFRGVFGAAPSVARRQLRGLGEPARLETVADLRRRLESEGAASEFHCWTAGRL